MIPTATAPPATPPNTDGEFKRGLSLLDATMLVVGSMIGSGIFIVSAQMTRELGSAGWLLAVWVLAGVMTIVAAALYGDLVARFPRAGGQYVYLREAFGPLAGGWLACRYRRGEVYPEGSRMTQRPDGYRRYESDAVFDALEALEREASELGVSPAGLAIAWILGVPEITAVVVGPTRAEQLEPVREALGLSLGPEWQAHVGGLFA